MLSLSIPIVECSSGITTRSDYYEAFATRTWECRGVGGAVSDARRSP